jgi:hypothetical protein
LGDGKMLRGDVEGWLAEQDKALRERAEKLQTDTLGGLRQPHGSRLPALSSGRSWPFSHAERKR